MKCRVSPRLLNVCWKYFLFSAFYQILRHISSRGSYYGGHFGAFSIKWRLPAVDRDLISLKDEYRNMAGDKLPLTNDPLPNIQTNKAGFGTDLTVGDKYENLINIKGAKFLDLYRGSIKIDDADDLKEALKSYDVEMSIAFNDNPDNDEFRKAYIVVITNLTEKGETPEQPTTGAVKFAKDVNTDGKLGTLSNAKVETLANGTTTVDFEISKPDWAFADGTAADLTIKYKVYTDGVLAAVEQTSASTAAAGWTGKAVANALAGNVKTADAAKVSGFIFNKDLTNGPVLSANDAKGTTVTVEITDVEWTYAVVEYEDAAGNTLKPTANATVKLPLDKDNAAAIKVEITGAVTVAPATISIKGAASETDGAEFTDIDVADIANGQGVNTDAAYYAVGKQPVVVTVDPDDAIAETVKFEVDDKDTVTGGGDDFTDGNGTANINKFVKIDDNTDASTSIGIIATAVGGTVDKGGNATFNLNLSGAVDDPRVENYVVTVSLNGQEISHPMNGTTGVAFTFNNVQKDLKLTANDISVKPILKLYAQSAVIYKDYVEITFSDSLANYCDLSKVTVTDNNTSGVAKDTYSVNGKVLTINVKTASLQAGDEIAIAADAVATKLNATGTIDAGEGNVGTATITIAVKGDAFKVPTIALT